MSESFLDGKVTLLRGDCLELLATLEEGSIDSCVTDPPYHLTSIVKRFGKPNAAECQFGSDGAYARASKGFMNKQWDGGDIAFQSLVWELVFRVLKPGAHLIAFGGTRTYHRMACAIEDAGFEIRDQIGWCYGSGFPKSHDISKGVDRLHGANREVVGYDAARARPNKENFAKRNDRQPSARAVDGWKDNGATITAPATEAAIQWQGWGTALKPAWEPIVLARKPISESSIAANVLKHGCGGLNIDACRVETTAQRPYNVKSWEQEQHLCASCAARAANKLKHIAPEIKESIATKPVEQTLSAKARTSQAATSSVDTGCSDGTTAGNINTSLSTEKSGKPQTAQFQKGTRSTTSTETKATTALKTCNSCGAAITEAFTNANTPQRKNGSPQGERPPAATGARWPANLIHDGSEEVVGMFPDTADSKAGWRNNNDQGMEGWGNLRKGPLYAGHEDSGSAARFFYTAKADSDDRLGSKHPTVKPLDLIQYLCRLITPKNGICLDPFAGTGTLGEAAWREGFMAVLIEREEEYQADIVRRMALCLAGPDERSRESVKARGLAVDAGPLFGGG